MLRIFIITIAAIAVSSIVIVFCEDLKEFI